MHFLHIAFSIALPFRGAAKFFLAIVAQNPGRMPLRQPGTILLKAYINPLDCLVNGNLPD